MTDGIEKFEVTDWDLENEFNPNRVKHNLTKKQQIYGVFASDDSDEDERPGFGRKASSASMSHINFISGGVRTVGEKPEQKASDDEENGSSEDEAPLKPKPPPPKSYRNQQSGLSGSRNARQIAGLRSLQKNSKSV